MATVTNKRKVLSTEGKAKVIRHTENGKMKSDMRQGFGLVNTMIQIIWKNRNKIISAFEENE